MKEVLARFEKVAAAHGLNADAAAAMRALLGDAHTAGFAKHMAIAEAASAPVPEAVEPEEEEEDSVRTLVHAVRKEIRKGLKKEVRKAVRKQFARSSTVAQQ
jgi:hypothetical protein